MVQGGWGAIVRRHACGHAQLIISASAISGAVAYAHLIMIFVVET